MDAYIATCDSVAVSRISLSKTNVWMLFRPSIFVTRQNCNYILCDCYLLNQVVCRYASSCLLL